MMLLRSADVRPLAALGAAGLAAVACMIVGASPGLTDIGRAEPHDAPAFRRRVVIGNAAEAPHLWDVALRDARTIDVNQADASELERLPGVGRVLAGRIVADRAARGVFVTPDDLLRVRGIGRKTLEGIEAYLNFN